MKRLIVRTACVLFLTWLLLQAVSPATLAVDYSLKIISPADGATVTTEIFTVTVDYVLPASESFGTVGLAMTATNDPASAIDRHHQDVADRSGRVSFTIDLSGAQSLSSSIFDSLYAPGPKTIEVKLVGNTNKPITENIFSVKTSIVINFNPPLAPPPTVEPGAIYIQSDPGDAEIWINDKQQVNTNFGPTPVGFTDLPPDTYTVFIRKDGYQDYKEVVNLASYEIHDINVKLQPGTSPTGWIQVNSDPSGVQIFLNSKLITTAPVTLTDVPPGNYDITLKKDGYEDYNDTITVTAGKITEVNATLPPVSGGFPVAPVAGGAAAIAAAGGLIKVLKGRGKPAAVKTSPQPPGADPYSVWWKDASPAARKSWDGFDSYMTGKYGPAHLTGYQDVNGNPSWSSAIQSYQQEIKGGKTKGAFDDWVKQQTAGESQIKDMWQQQDKMAGWRPQEIIDADKKYGDTVKAQQTLKKLTGLTSSDPILTDFITRATASDSLFGADGHIDTAKVSKLEGTVKKWIQKDQAINQIPEYTDADAWKDTAGDIQSIAHSWPLRIGVGIVTVGISEGFLIPLSAASTTIQLIDAGVPMEKAANLGLQQGIKETGYLLATVGAIKGVGAGIQYVAGRYGYTIRLFSSSGTGAASDAAAVSEGSAGKIGKIKDPALAEDVNNFKKLAGESGGPSTRANIMNQKFKSGETPDFELSPAEKAAVDLKKKYGQSLNANENALPSDLKDALGTANQKIYQNAQNKAIVKTMEKMKADGVKVEGKTFEIQQTGTHAQAENPGYKPFKSDADHTAGFSDPKYNKYYEEQLNQELKQYGYGTDVKSPSQDFGANVYGDGASNTDVYQGGPLKQVEHMNDTTGSLKMIKSEGGQVTVTTETPQYTNSLNSKWAEGDYDSAAEVYKKFAGNSIADQGGINKIMSDPQSLQKGIKSISKEASRFKGQYGASSAEQFRVANTSTPAGQSYKFSRYEPPKAAQVADYIKRNGLSVEDAKIRAGYSGSDADLYRDLLKLVGI